MSTERKFLKIQDVKAATGKSRTAIYRDIQGGTFPAPIRIGARSVAWDSTAIARWQEDRINASSPVAGGSAACRGNL